MSGAQRTDTRDQSVISQLISVDQAAEYLGVTSSTIRRWISDGSIRGYRVGVRFIRVHKADLDSLVTPLGPWYRP